MGEHTRQQVYRAWLSGHRTARAIEGATGIPKSTAARHLQAMRDETLERVAEQGGQRAYVADTLEELDIAAGIALAMLIAAEDVGSMNTAAAALDRTQMRRMKVLDQVYEQVTRGLVRGNRIDPTLLDELLLGRRDSGSEA